MSAMTEAPSIRSGQYCDGLAGLIHPVDPETFEQDYRDVRPLIVWRGNPDYYAGLLTLPGMDAILATMSVPASAIRLASEGKTTQLAELAGDDSGQAAEILYDRYRKGATINVNALNWHWPALDTLCRALTAELTASVQVNVYLTPRHARGLKPHFDTHDVFVAQVHGTKHWRLYDSELRLPGPGQPCVAPADGFGPPVRELHLEPGDLMYLPRGTVHDA